MSQSVERQKIVKPDWINIIFLVATPILAIFLTTLYVMRHGFVWMDLGVFLLMYFATGLSIGGGYHRLFSHRAYTCHPAIQWLYLFFAAGTFQNSALRWSRDHRLHHQFVDQEKDPYNIKKGFWWAHIGWIFYQSNEDDDFTVAPDLERDPLVQWQEKYYLPIAVSSGLLLPTLIGWAYGRPFAGLLWGGLVRLVITHHATFSINSVAHYLGGQPYSTKHTARDSWITALISFGEGYHNYHHTFAADYRNGVRWWQYDPVKWMINVLNFFGLIGRMTRFREDQIRKAILDVQAEQARKNLEVAPGELRRRLETRIANAREQYELALSRWQEARGQLKAMRRNAIRKKAQALKMWKLKTRGYKLELQTAQVRWALLMAAISRIGQNPGVQNFIS